MSTNAAPCWGCQHGGISGVSCWTVGMSGSSMLRTWRHVLAASRLWLHCLILRTQCRCCVICAEPLLPRSSGAHAAWQAQLPIQPMPSTQICVTWPAVQPDPIPRTSGLTSSLCAALEVKGKMLHLGDVCKMLRNSEDPKAVLQALQALRALLPARPEELSLYAGKAPTHCAPASTPSPHVSSMVPGSLFL